MRAGQRLRQSAGLVCSLATVLMVLGTDGAALLYGQTRRSPVVIATEKASPAVVSILSAKTVERSRSPFGSFGRDPLFDDFFRDFFSPYKQRQTERSLGSGVVIRPDGYILTNEHVILQSETVQIQLANERKLDAHLVGADSDSDLAVLKVKDGQKLPYIPLGSSHDLMIGETVIAIGNPFGLSHTVTTGVVSALNRSLNTGERTYYDFIQTDASINPGNSGGPLLNIKGELIGINTAIYGKARGIGFAIPVSRAKRIVQDLINYGAVETPWVGLVVQTLTPELAAHFLLQEGQGGVLVRGVEPGSPAARAGIRRGEVILSLDGQRLRTAEEYLQRERERSSGDRLQLQVLRGNREKTLQIETSRFPLQKADDLAWQLLGITLGETRGGLEVRTIRPGSPAVQIGMQRGDVVRGVSGTPTPTVDVFRRKMIAVRLSQSILLSVSRGRQRYHVTMPLDHG